MAINMQQNHLYVSQGKMYLLWILRWTQLQNYFVGKQTTNCEK